jgi:hypothetical protein
MALRPDDVTVAAQLGTHPAWGQADAGEMEGTMLAVADDCDDSLKALNYILNAWEEAAENGISPEMMAYAALYAALTDLVGAFGEGAVVKLISELGPRIEKGEFTIARSKQ